MVDINSAILSSDEVERLLSSFHEGKLDVEQTDVIEEGGIIKYYDFKRPNTISREKRRMLYKLYEATAYHMSKEITNYLKTSVKVNLDSIDELSFGIFKNTCPELVFIETIKLKPMQGFGCITIDLGLCLSIAERAFGGQGKSQNEVRKLTDIEVAILDDVVSIILEKIKGAWEAFIEIDWKVSETAMESRYLNIASDAEVLLLVSFTINLDYSFGEMKLCVPVSSMEYTLEKFASSNNPSLSKEVSKESAESLRKLVKDLNVIVTGVLDETSVTVDDLINLKEGDVMRLDSKITDDLKITVEGKNKFYGKLGLLGSKKAMQITSYVEERPDASH
ncbi:MAG: flagellar motor switch protein FliM [Candidatus Scalindua sediminis]|nr:flagellar motor switch protein FliM [Candidatus Scalindua sediminis]